MLRLHIFVALVLLLSAVDESWSQSTAANPRGPSPGKKLFITVQEKDRPDQKCQVLKYWKTAHGYNGYQVRAVDTGELMTILEEGPVTHVNEPSATPFRAVATRIYRYGKSSVPPKGIPGPPADAVVLDGAVPSANPADPVAQKRPSAPTPTNPRAVSAAVPARAVVTTTGSTSRDGGVFLMVQEVGKPGQKCQVLKYWKKADGQHGYQVRAVDTGELMTVLEIGAIKQVSKTDKTSARAVDTHVYRYGKSSVPPQGVPTPPADAVALKTSAPASPPAAPVVQKHPVPTSPRADAVVQKTPSAPTAPPADPVVRTGPSPVPVPPVKAVVPTTPSTPSKPLADPVVRTSPSAPSTPPADPVVPKTPATTSSTTDPVVRTGPSAPSAPPADPVVRTNPSAPSAPPADPVVRTSPSAPSTPPVDPVVPKTPAPTSPTTDPVVRTGPSAPAAPTVDPGSTRMSPPARAVITTPVTHPSGKAVFITVDEAGKLAQKCQVLKYWKTADGHNGYQARAVDTGELMTVLEEGPARQADKPGEVPVRVVPTKLYRYGDSKVPPSDVPAPPADAVVLNTPAPAVPSVEAVGLKTPSAPTVPSTDPATTWTAPSTKAVVTTSDSSPSGKEVFVLVEEEGKLAQKCQVLKYWKTGDGNNAYQARAVDTGELMTVQEEGPVTHVDKPDVAPFQAVAAQVYRYGDSSAPPRGVPAPPADAVAVNGKEPSAPSAKAVARTTPSAPVSVPSVPRPTQTARVEVTPSPASTPLTSPYGTSGKAPLPAETTSVSPTAPTMPKAITTAPQVTSSDSKTQHPLLNQILGRSGPEPKKDLSPTSPQTVQAPPTVPPTPAGKEVKPQSAPVETVGVKMPAPRSPSGSVPTPGDWRKSWGAVEQTSAGKTGEDQENPGKGITPYTRKEVAVDYQSPPPTAKLAGMDPLMDPASYTKPGAVEEFNIAELPEVPEIPGLPGVPVQSPVQPVTNATLPTLPGENRVETPTSIPLPVLPPAIPGMGSVRAVASPELANLPEEESPASPTSIPSDAPNAFTQMLDPSQQQQLAAMGMVPGRMPPMMPGMMPGGTQGMMAMQPPMLPPTPYNGPGQRNSMAMMGAGYPMGHPGMAHPAMVGHGLGSGIPQGLNNAFTQGTTTRPIPADFGQHAMVPNAFIDPTSSGMVPPQLAMAPPAMMYMTPGMPPRNQVPPQGQLHQTVYSASKANLSELAAVIRDSIYPSQREQATEELGKCGADAREEAIEILKSAARKDPAATVRAASIRALVRLKANTPEVMALLQEMTKDKDVRVRHEAGNALAEFGSGTATATDR